jgi:hypothetical protein
MQPTFKQYADFLIFALEIGICNASDVVAWGDQLVDQHEKPEYWMIELSTSARKHILDISHQLGNIDGLADLNISFKLLLAELGKKYPALQSEYITESEAIRLTSRLYRFVHAEISDDFKAALYTVDSALDYWEYCAEIGSGKAERWAIVQQDYQDLLQLSRAGD